MEKGYFADASPVMKIMLSVIVVTVCFFIITFIGIAISIPLFHLDFSNFSASVDFTNPANIGFLKFMQTVQSLGLFIVPPFVIGWLIYRKSFSFLALNQKPLLISMLFVVLLIVSALPFVNFLAEVNSHMRFPDSLKWIEYWMKDSEKSATQITELFLKVNNIGGLIVNIIIIAVMPALGEELLFRGVIQKLFTELFGSYHAGIVFAAMLFSAFHVQFYGFLPRMVLGMMFGYLFVWSRTIWMPILAHFINNCFAVVAYYLVERKVIGNDADTIGTNQETMYYAFISCATVFMIMFAIYKREERRFGEV